MNKLFFPFLLVFIAFNVNAHNKRYLLDEFVRNYYHEIQYEGKKPEYDVFKKGMIGYLNLKMQGKLRQNDLLTIIDFRLSSNKKRIWVIDMDRKKVIYHNLVAHGRNTGNEFARHFSN
ncbi:MAG: murein L,D-transpeptidase catalytic domain family protein, partial [Fulvivirga sp.]|nr:murein L,D-transpeptidase catalytic domain family protein [Fulvivirga sp.]